MFTVNPFTGGLQALSNGTIIYKTKYNEYWKENIKLFKAGNLSPRGRSTYL